MLRISDFEKRFKYMLDTNNPLIKRAIVIDELYDAVKSLNKSDDYWNKLLWRLTKKFRREPKPSQVKLFGLLKTEFENNFKELHSYYKNLIIKEKDRVLYFYSIIYSVIKKLLNKNDMVLEIGFGQQPLFINFLNSIGYECFGIEPKYEEPDNKTTFKTSFPNLPKELNKDYDLVFAVFVFSLIYDENMKLKNNEKGISKVLSKLSSIIKPGGYLVLGDCFGTIFKKSKLDKEFKILMFEKDIIINGYEKALTLTILKKK